jgi:uncharacterized protein YggE
MLMAAVMLMSLGASTGVVFAQTPPPDPPSISTQGEAIVKVAPDIAWVTARVEARAGKPGEAQRKAAEIMTTVQEGLKAVGVPAAAMRTLSYSLHPEMERSGGTSRIAGYVATNVVEVRVEDLQALGRIIDAAAASGAGTVTGLRFDVKDREAIERDALLRAAKDALARATAIATGLGQTAGPVLRVHDQSVSQAPPRFTLADEGVLAGRGGGRGAGPPQTPVELGELEIRARVTLLIGIAK